MSGRRFFPRSRIFSQPKSIMRFSSRNASRNRRDICTIGGASCCAIRVKR